MKYDGLLFDLDGTLWDATENIRTSWNIAIKDFKGLENRELTAKELQGVMGLPMDEIAAKLFSEYPKEKQLDILQHCCEIENEYLTNHGGILFPNVEKTLSNLSKNFKLCIVSNGQAGYIQTFLTSHNMNKYFTDFQNWGDNQVPKGENIKLVMKRNSIKHAAYIGDTLGDFNAAKLAGIDFIYAKYGFGEVEKPDYIINSFEELEQIVD